MLLDRIDKKKLHSHIENGQGWILLSTAIMMIVMGGTGLWFEKPAAGKRPPQENPIWIEIQSPDLPHRLKPFFHPPNRSELLETLGYTVLEDSDDQRITRSCRAVIHPLSSKISIRHLSGRAALALGRRIDINLATRRDLTLLSGIGPVTARRIVTERETGGPFASVEDLRRVYGIGPETIERLKPFIKAGNDVE